MLIQGMAEAIGRVHGAALDAVTRALWGAVAAGQIGGEDAGRLSEVIEARRMPIDRAGRHLEAMPAETLCEVLSKAMAEEW